MATASCKASRLSARNTTNASLVLLVVQVASMGGLIPLATAPAVFQLLGGVLPLPLAIDALTTLVQGGGASVAGPVAGLVAWTVVAVANVDALVPATRYTGGARTRLAGALWIVAFAVAGAAGYIGN